MKPNTPVVKRVLRTLVRLAAERRGATAIEYGLIIALMVIAMIVGLTTLANTTNAMWNHVNGSVANAR